VEDGRLQVWSYLYYWTVEEDGSGELGIPSGAGWVDGGQVPEDAVTDAAFLLGLGIAGVRCQVFGEDVAGIPILVGAGIGDTAEN
jgi:hypothetical protein